MATHRGRLVIASIAGILLIVLGAAVIAAETFSDLRTVATGRAPFFFTSRIIARAFQLAEQQGSFQVDAASPVVAGT